MISVGIKILLGTAFAVLGCWVVYLAIEMVGIFGEGMGVDETSRKIYARAHIAVHVFGTASSIAVGLLVLGRNRGLAALSMAAILLCGGYGIVNMIGFTTTNRLSVSESRPAATAADWKHYEAQRANLQGELDWLRKTEVNADTPRESKLLLKRIDDKLKELNAIQPPRPSADKVLADPQATWFSAKSIIGITYCKCLDGSLGQGLGRGPKRVFSVTPHGSGSCRTRHWWRLFPGTIEAADPREHLVTQSAEIEARAFDSNGTARRGSPSDPQAIGK
jgi:hypothetical protein